MINLEKQKENFKNHVATLTDYDNIKILDFKNPKSNEYRIRFLFEEDYYRLHISGDLGELIATNYCNMTFEKFSDFVNDVGYFEGKIDNKKYKINWMPKHKYIYEQHYGKIPEGYFVIFLDNNQMNFDISNLYCVNRKIHAIMSKNKWYTNNKENTLTAIKWCELYYVLKNNKKNI